MAAVDPAAGKPWRDGPAFNRRIGALVQTNVVELLGSTFSDHMLPYFREAFNAANEAQAREVLETIYGTAIVPGETVFWTPEMSTRAQRPVRTTVLSTPLTLTSLSSHASVLLFPTPATLSDPTGCSVTAVVSAGSSGTGPPPPTSPPEVNE